MVGRTMAVAEKARLPAADRVQLGGYDAASMAKINSMVDKVCCDFAADVDWHYHPDATSFVLGENPKGLHAGGYIKISAVPAANLLRLRAGCYDMYFQPMTVCERNVALSGLNQRKLGGLLNETHEKLTTYYLKRVS